jgi:Flp pilus assembly protein TadG
MVSPPLIAMLFGVFQLGWAMHCGSTARYAVEEAARAVMISPNLSAAQLKDQIQDRLERVAVDSTIDVAVSYDSTSGARVATVAAVYRHRITIPFLASWTLVFRPQATAPA